MRKDITWADFEEGDDLPKIWDPGYRRVVYDELPTLSVKKFAKRNDAITTENIASAHFGSGSTIRITRLHLETRSQDISLYLKDASGTIDNFRLENNPAGSYRNNLISVYELGSPKSPLYVARTHFTIFNVGTVAAGTVITAFEGFKHPAEVGHPLRDG